MKTTFLKSRPLYILFLSLYLCIGKPGAGLSPEFQSFRAGGGLEFLPGKNIATLTRYSFLRSGQNTLEVLDEVLRGSRPLLLRTGLYLAGIKSKSSLIVELDTEAVAFGLMRSKKLHGRMAFSSIAQRRVTWFQPKFHWGYTEFVNYHLGGRLTYSINDSWALSFSVQYSDAPARR